MNHERFKDIWSGIQSIVVSVALVVGGGWTLYSFVALHQGEKARAEVTEMQLRMQRQANVQISIEASHRPDATSKDILLFVTVTVHNAGNRNIYLQYPGGTPLTVTRVDVKEDGTNIFHESTRPILYSDRKTGYVVEGTLIGADGTDKNAFVVRLSQKGVYRLQFQAAFDDHDRVVASTAESSATEFFWGASSYHVVD